MKDVVQYLKTKLEDCSKYEINESEKHDIQRNGLESFIYQKLTSGKFRKWSINLESQNWTRAAIHLNVSANQPLKIIYPFGGYKLWRLPTAPLADWAEFISISYYSAYLAPIIRSYSPGVELYLFSYDYILERMSNIPVIDTENYLNSLSDLIKNFSLYFPENFRIKIIRPSEFYNQFELETELKNNFNDFQKKFSTLSKERREKMLKSSELNVKFNGAVDWSRLSDAAKKEKITLGPIYHDAYCGLSKVQGYLRQSDKVIIYTTAINAGIPIGTAKTSVTKFWIGCGVLEQCNDSFKDRILSPQQVGMLDLNSVEIVKVDLLASSNFKEIVVLKAI